MNKRLITILSIVSMVTILLATGCIKKTVLSYEDGIKAGCFDAGGFIGPEGCVPQEPEVITIVETVFVEVLVTPTPIPYVNTDLDPRCPHSAVFGTAGKFKAEWDYQRQTCIIGMHEHSRLTEGLTLADIVEEGLSFTFEMPFDGYINHSAEFISVNGVTCTPANPIRCGGTSLIQEGDEVSVSTAAGNTSAGIFLIQEKP